MSSWTTLTLNTNDDDLDEKLDKDIRNLYPDSGCGNGKRTVNFNGYIDHNQKAKKFAEEFPEAEYIIVISTNDTSDRGRGTLFEITINSDFEMNEEFNEHPIIKIDEKKGIEGAIGGDVVEYFNTEYGLDSYSRRRS